MDPIQQNIKLIIMMGLPGSGKTYYANHYQPENKENILVIHFDEFMDSYKDIKMLIHDQVINYMEEHCSISNILNTIIMDGPWFTAKDINKVIDKASFAFNEVFEVDYSWMTYKFIINDIEIIHFSENREFCLYNDRFRREKSSSITIKNASFDNTLPQNILDEIKSKYNINSITVKYMNTEKHSIYETVFLPKANYKDKYLKSQEWVTGGKWGNCWGDEGEVSVEEPKEFDEFDNLLLALCPDIPFLKYKKLFNACCKAGDRSENDYYGGYTNYSFWICDLKKLYEMMSEMKMIDTGEENDDDVY